MADLAALMAAQGLRVAVVDTDIQSPGIHVLCGLGEDDMGHTLNDCGASATSARRRAM